MDINNHFSFNLQLGNQRWSETSSVGLGFFPPLNADNAEGADLCPASWAIQGKMVFGTGNVKGEKLQRLCLESCLILLPLEPEQGWVRKVSHFPWWSQCWWLLWTALRPNFYQKYTWRGLCGERCGINSVLSWGSGSVLQNFVASGTKYWEFYSRGSQGVG